MVILRDRATVLVVLATATILRFSFAFPGFWQQPWTPHHFDEHILPQEAVALWEGVTPREVGWPASPLRLLLSASYAGPLLADTRAAIANAPDAAAAMSAIARWIGDRASDPAVLYVSGRSVSALIGVLHVFAAMMAARIWLGSSSVPLAGALVAVSPLAVSHSQLLLADVTGACLATFIVALTPRLRSTPLMVPWLGVLAALATASKFHFGVWLLLPLISIWLVRPEPGVPAGRLKLTVALLAAFAVTFVALWPWLWLNPVLALKEFAGIVVAKIGSGVTARVFAANAWMILGGLGSMVLLGAGLGVAPLIRESRRLGILLFAIALVTLVVLARSAILFERYGLVVLPGLGLAATAGWLSLSQRLPRFGQTAAVSAVLLVGVPSSLNSIGQFRLSNSYHAAHAWMLNRLPPGASVVIYSEDNQYLPRTADQLAACATYVTTDAAYREKWATNQVIVPAGSGSPMQSAVLADELYQAYWCAREALAVRAPAFVVHRFHSEPRFQTLTVAAMREGFLAGLADASVGYDAVLVHWDLFPGLVPSASFNVGSGPLLRLYLRPGLTLRHGVTSDSVRTNSQPN